MLINNALVLGTFNRHNNNIQRREKNVETLSSGKRINKAADDASGLSICESMKAQIRGLSQGQRNTQDGLSLLQYAEGQIQGVHEDLLKMREMSIRFSNDTYSDSDREIAEKEFEQLKKDITYISKTAEVNGIKVMEEDKKLQIHVRYEPYKVEEIGLRKINLDSLDLSSENILSRENSSKCLEKIDNALEKVLDYRESLGVTMNRFECLLKDSSNAENNTTASLSRIEDIGTAMASMNLFKNDVLVKYTNAMMAHANQDTNNTIQLLK
ncbi:flagellin [Clostridiaceae bacterium 14S0207]|nr:flagellin [Clostridiaceae bacterium 14S0207]